jgi:Txe/YoeB family toxin of toxin-antitoxin system
MYKIVFTKQALKDLENLKKSGISSKAKILIDIIRENPYQVPPRYEKLVGNLDGVISRRINIQHRLVYQVYEEPFVENGTRYDGTIKIMATAKEDADNAIQRIKDIVAEPEVGQIYKGTVSGMKDFGLFVKIMNGFEAMVHISEITGERIAKIEDTKIKEGDTVYVRYLGADKRGKTRMSMVGIDQKTGEEIKK